MSPGSASIASATSGTARAARRRAPGRRVQADLDEAGQLAAGRPGRRAEGADEADPVHGVHHVGVPGHAARLVGLQLPDEVPGERPASRGAAPARAARPGGGAGGRLGRGLLVPVLAEVGQAKLAQGSTSERPGLGDRDERELARVAARRRAGRADPGLTSARFGASSQRRSAGGSGSLEEVGDVQVVFLFEDHGTAAPGPVEDLVLLLARPESFQLDGGRAGPVRRAVE